MSKEKTEQIVIPYTPFEKQIEFHTSGADECVYGGAKGGGKSCALIMEALAYALEYPGSLIYLFRETYDDLEANLIREWKARVPAELYRYSETKHIAWINTGGALTSEIYFRYIQSFADAEGYQGRSIDFIGIDELTKHEERSVQVLLSCLRSPKGFPPRFRGTCNPGGIGHTWVKNRYIVPTRYGDRIVEDKISGNSLQFIPATVYDNTVLMENDPAYIRRLENLPEVQRRAFLHGDWDIFEGQAFQEFDERIHVVDPFPIPKHWSRWRSNDPGFNDEFAWYWFAVDEEGTVYIYREYTRDKGAPRVNYSDQAKQAAKYSEDEQISFTVTGHDAFNTHPLSETGKSIIDYYYEGGIKDCIKAVTNRKLRAATWHEYLRPYEGNEGKLTAKVKIFNSCKKLIETLPLQITDEKDIEVVAETDIDHWYDAAGYGLIAYHSNRSMLYNSIDYSGLPADLIEDLDTAPNDEVRMYLLKKWGRVKD